MYGKRYWYQFKRSENHTVFPYPSEERQLFFRLKFMPLKVVFQFSPQRSRKIVADTYMFRVILGKLFHLWLFVLGHSIDVLVNFARIGKMVGYHLFRCVLGWKSYDSSAYRWQFFPINGIMPEILSTWRRSNLWQNISEFLIHLPTASFSRLPYF